MIMFGSIPFFGWSVWRNPNVKDLLFSGWTPIIIAMLISRYVTSEAKRETSK
jgi:solute carrier family 41